MSNPSAPPPSYASVTNQPPSYDPTQSQAYTQPPQPTTVQPGYVPPPNQQQQPPYAAGAPQTGVPGAGYGNATTIGPGTYVMGNTVAGAGLSPVNTSRDPISVTCQFCNRAVVTRVDYVNGQTVNCCALILCAMGCWCGCCLVPCCIQTYKDADHYCPECNMKLGTCLPQSGYRHGHHHY